MQHAISLPIFGALSDPRAVVDVATAAEGHGWDAIFVWDHLLRPVEQATHIADPWITLTAIAMIIAYLLWARAERTWPFGPKEIRESFTDRPEQAPA